MTAGSISTGVAPSSVRRADAGVGGLTVLGVMGEAAELTRTNATSVVACVGDRDPCRSSVGVSGDPPRTCPAGPGLRAAAASAA